MRLAYAFAARLSPLVLMAACGGPPAPTLDRAALEDPESCRTCHPTQYAEWSGSMHAYAGEDPVFRAMNARGQRETKGTLGSFCVSCHAPLALRGGLTSDGTNLDSVPRKLRGITCFFCHSVDQVEGDHNNPLHLADDLVLRGGIPDPVDTPAHRSAYSPLHDRQVKSAAALCGSCHDIVTPGGLALERTYQEWQGTVYEKEGQTTLRTCGKCHMPGTPGQAAQAEGAPMRTIHSHAFPGVDLAMTDFPNLAQQRAAVADELNTSISAKLCVMPDAGSTRIEVTLDNVAVGHGWPSGAAQDRRAWVELVASTRDQPLLQRGVVKDGEEPSALPEPDLWLFRDQLFDAQDKPVHMFWEAARYSSLQVPPTVTNDRNDERYFHAITRTYTVQGAPDRVTLRVRIRPFGLDVLDDLAASGDLDRSLRDKVPTFDLRSTVLEWKEAGGFGCVP